VLKAKVVYDGSGMFPSTEYHCPACNHLHHYYSVPQKQCIMCGQEFWNIRAMIDTLSCRIGYYRSGINDKNICGNERI